MKILLGLANCKRYFGKLLWYLVRYPLKIYKLDIFIYTIINVTKKTLCSCVLCKRMTIFIKFLNLHVVILYKK